MNTDEILKESEFIKTNYINFSLEYYTKNTFESDIGRIKYKEKARENLKLINEGKIEGCCECLESEDELREPYFCGDKGFYCEICKEKITQAKKNFEDILK